jgi:hypothetical protein
MLNQIFESWLEWTLIVLRRSASLLGLKHSTLRNFSFKLEHW